MRSPAAEVEGVCAEAGISPGDGECPARALKESRRARDGGWDGAEEAMAV